MNNNLILKWSNFFQKIDILIIIGIGRILNIHTAIMQQLELQLAALIIIIYAWMLTGKLYFGAKILHFFAWLAKVAFIALYLKGPTYNY